MGLAVDDDDRGLDRSHRLVYKNSWLSEGAALTHFSERVNLLEIRRSLALRSTLPGFDFVGKAELLMRICQIGVAQRKSAVILRSQESLRLKG